MQDIGKILFKESFNFQFFQAVWLLERFLPDADPPGESFSFRKERILFRPHNSLAFPPTDIKSIDRIENDLIRRDPYVRMTLSFMGLYGIASPLPICFHDNIVFEEGEYQALQHFLEMFDHRFYSFFYQALKRFRPIYYFIPGQKKTHTHLQQLICLTGLGVPHTLKHSPFPPLSYLSFVGRLLDRVRNAEGLQCLIRNFFQGIPVKIIENFDRWAPIPNRARLGADMCLGEDSQPIGATLFDLTSKFRVLLGPVPFSVFSEFITNRDAIERLTYLIRLYLRDYLDFDVEVRIRSSDIPSTRLGNSDTRLGLSTWIGKPDADIISRVIQFD